MRLYYFSVPLFGWRGRECRSGGENSPWQTTLQTRQTQLGPKRAWSGVSRSCDLDALGNARVLN
jgi:hypothetical protein